LKLKISKIYRSTFLFTLLGLLIILSALAVFFQIHILRESDFGFVWHNDATISKPQIDAPTVLKIPKLGIETPVIQNVDPNDKKKYNEALKTGVLHFPGTTLPGQGSNIFIYGHSSSAVDSGPYSKIFAPLDKLEKNDEILVLYNNQEYKYQVNEKNIVDKNDVSVLKPTQIETLTLMTCWPVGTDQKRLIIRAERKD
jgi:sortase A